MLYVLYVSTQLLIEPDVSRRISRISQVSSGLLTVVNCWKWDFITATVNRGKKRVREKHTNASYANGSFVQLKSEETLKFKFSIRRDQRTRRSL